MTQQPLYEFGGQGPVMHIALANGFPPLTYHPLLDAFTADYRVISLPPRGLWPGIGAPPQEPDNWESVAQDLLDGLRHYQLEDVIAIGHSFGAVASMLAVLAEPSRFRALILLDPTLLPPHAMEMIKAMHEQGLMPRFPLVEQAQVRRNQFSDVQAAFDYWRGKSLFKDWSDEALWLYTRSMTQPAADGTGVELTWPREWEAYYYMSINPDMWEITPRLNGLLPTLIIAGGATDTFMPESVEKAKALLPDATHVTLPGYGHLFPHSAPAPAQAIIAAWLTKL